MKNFELPLYLVANEERGRADLHTITQAHLIYCGLEEGEYHNEAPDLDVLAAPRLFAELEGPSWKDRLERINIGHQAKRLPKCLDIPLAFASGDDIDRARWLVEDMIDQGILHEPVGQHREFFEQADVQEKAFEQVAEAEAERRRKKVMRNLRRDN